MGVRGVEGVKGVAMSLAGVRIGLKGLLMHLAGVPAPVPVAGPARSGISLGVAPTNGVSTSVGVPLDSGVAILVSAPVMPWVPISVPGFVGGVGCACMQRDLCSKS